ncbi:MAG: hypothetical protein OJF47_001483 [Nitrospira sp.]|nr:MAG: hypothetical protein OJF47_001483 [Nitrospira sp.]
MKLQLRARAGLAGFKLLGEAALVVLKPVRSHHSLLFDVRS